MALPREVKVDDYVYVESEDGDVSIYRITKIDTIVVQDLSPLNLSPQTLINTSYNLWMVPTDIFKILESDEGGGMLFRTLYYDHQGFTFPNDKHVYTIWFSDVDSQELAENRPAETFQTYVEMTPVSSPESPDQLTPEGKLPEGNYQKLRLEV
jgi:hypothetical protein